MSSDGRLLIAEDEQGRWILSLESGDRRPALGLDGTGFVSWSDDPRWLFAWDETELPFRVFRVEPATGRRELWRTIMPQDPAGIWSADLLLTRDGKSYLYNCKRTINELFLVTGVR